MDLSFGNNKLHQSDNIKLIWTKLIWSDKYWIDGHGQPKEQILSVKQSIWVDWTYEQVGLSASLDTKIVA